MNVQRNRKKGQGKEIVKRKRKWDRENSIWGKGRVRSKSLKIQCVRVSLKERLEVHKKPIRRSSRSNYSKDSILLVRQMKMMVNIVQVQKERFIKVQYNKITLQPPDPAYINISIQASI